MAQLNPDQYRRLTGSSDYARSDGLYEDKTNGQICVVMNDSILARFDATGITADLEVSGEARGNLLRRGASAWEVLAAKTAGKIICGDGTDVISATMSGDASISAAGAVTLANPQKLNSAQVTLTPDTIVGNSAGDLGHADGVELVAAVANKIIVPESIVLNYTFGVAAYIDGGNISAGYKDGAAITGVASAAASLGAGASNINLLIPVDGLALVNKGLVMRSAAAFNNPGTATGTASVRVLYRLIDA